MTGDKISFKSRKWFLSTDSYGKYWSNMKIFQSSSSSSAAASATLIVSRQSEFRMSRSMRLTRSLKLKQRLVAVFGCIPLTLKGSKIVASMMFIFKTRTIERKALTRLDLRCDGKCELPAASLSNLRTVHGTKR